jgi:hypothetical protein
MFNNSKTLAACVPCPIDRGELLSDRDFARLMITHTRGYLMPASYATFIKYYPKLEDVAKSIVNQLKGY